MKRARVRVSGRVQGVYFRAETLDRARALGLAGRIRNLPDGTVEAVFEGPGQHVDSLVRWCEKGPPGARVDAVEVAWEEPVGEVGFRVTS